MQGTRKPVFDQAKLALALSRTAAERFEPGALPFHTFEVSTDGKSIAFDLASKRWRCDIVTYRCAQAARVNANEIPSPDRKRIAFLRDYNLWVRDAATGKERQLTTDGRKDFGYATDNAGWRRSDRPIVTWSPDSRRIATFQQDQRGVGEMYLVPTEAGHPKLRAWKYPIAGDSVVFTIQRVIIDVDQTRVVRLAMPPDAYRFSCYAADCEDGMLADAHWTADGSRLAFVSSSRDYKRAQVRVADAATGAVRTVVEEQVPTFYESAPWRGADIAMNWRYLQATNEVIWFSKRDNWGHLYLYDAAHGTLKHQITRGDWNMVELLKVDEKLRMLYVLGAGREQGRHPYFLHLYKVSFDGKQLALLTPEDATHDVSFAPSGAYFVDSYSTPDVPPTTVLKDGNGKLIRILERADISRLVAAGWRPPIPTTVKARDGVTDLVGLMFKPANFDANAKYPIVNLIYPGPFAQPKHAEA